MAGALPADIWRRLSAGQRTKGERLYDWAYCPLADLDADEYKIPIPGLWTRGLLIRRGIETALPAIGCRIEAAPAGTKLVSLAAVPGPTDEQRFDTRAEHTALWVYQPVE